MKIALIHYSSPPVVGGVESVLAHHARLLSRAGHQVTILTGRGAQTDPQVEVKILPLLDSRHPAVMEVKQKLDRGIHPPEFATLRDATAAMLQSALENTDILIAHNVASLHKNLALTAAIFQRYQTETFPRLILWHHDLAWTTPRYQAELHNGYPWDLLRHKWPGARHVTVSRLRKQELTELTGIPAEQIEVIPNGVDLRAFYKLEKQTSELLLTLDLLKANPLFLLPVRLTPRKNIELALRVVACLRKDLPDARLVVTGPEGPHNPANKAYKALLLSLRDDLGLRGAVTFMAEVHEGFLPDAVIADFFRLADALLFPSLEEGFGIPLIEAGFSAMPVFCTDIPVLRELGGQDICCFQPEEDPCVIARQILERLQNDTTVRWRLRARQSYAWESIFHNQIGPLIAEVK